MVCEWGMSRAIGPVRLAGEREGHSLSGEFSLPGAKPFSEDTARLVDHEIHRIVEACYQRVDALVRKHRDDLERIARELMRREVLEAREIDLIMAGEALPEPPALREEPPAPAPPPAVPARNREVSVVRELLEFLDRAPERPMPDPRPPGPVFTGPGGQGVLRPPTGRW